MSNLVIKISPIPNGTEAHLIREHKYHEERLDSVAGETDYVLKCVVEWIELTDNLTRVDNYTESSNVESRE